MFSFVMAQQTRNDAKRVDACDRHADGLVAETAAKRGSGSVLATPVEMP